MHNDPFFPSLLAPILVGREAQRDLIERLITETTAGHRTPHVLLIRGEAGVGKSRLLAALHQRAAELGWRAVATTCFEQYQDVPYAPLGDLLRRAAGSADELAHALGPGVDLGDFLPERRNTRPITPDPQAVPPHPAQEQHRLFLALAAYIVTWSREQSALLVIEDLHWSDTASLAFLPVLARALVGLPVMLALTVRPEDTTASLRGVLAELNRQRLAVTIDLPRLSQNEMREMVQACLQNAQPLPQELLDTLYALTEGNPYFIEEVLAALVAGGDIVAMDGAWAIKAVREMRIPQSVQEAVAHRTTGLSPNARDVLTLAAVIGRQVDFAVLQRVTGYDEATLLGLLKELIGAHLLVEESADQFAFRHALACAAIYRTLLARERQRLHRQLAESLEQTSSVYLGDLALHFTQAQVWPKALQYAEAAARRAWSAYAPRETVDQLARALQAAERLPGTALAPLLHLRGRAYDLLDAFAAAQADYERALADAALRGDTADEWQALLDLGYHWTSRDFARADGYFQRALACARFMGDPARLAYSLNRAANVQMVLDLPFTARPLHQEALSIFEQLGDTRGVAETLDLLGVATMLCGDMAAGSAALGRAVALFTQLDARESLINSLTQRSARAEWDTEFVPLTPLTRGIAPLERAVQLAREIGWQAGEAMAQMVRGAHLLTLGAYGEAYNALRTSCAIADAVGHQAFRIQAHSALGVAHLHLLMFPQAVAELEQARALAEAAGMVLMVRCTAAFLALAFTQQQQFVDAETAMMQARRRPGHAEEPSVAERQLRRAEAELALARGAPERALELVDRLIGSAVQQEAGPIPTLWLLRGQALAGLHRYDEARAVLEAALAAAQAQERHPLIWRIQAALVRVALGQRRRDEAQQLAFAAHASIDEVAGTIAEAEMREAFQAQAYALVPDPGALTPRQALKVAFDGLTDREIEVVRLIARGYTNRQIAATLVLSERTVSTHIGNIYSKLGITTRVQAIRWAFDKGVGAA